MKTLATLALESNHFTQHQKDVIHRAAARAERASRVPGEPILQLPPNATPNEVNSARKRRSVRRGKDIFLPSWKPETTGFPNVLVRSALWSMRTIGLTPDGVTEAQNAVDQDTISGDIDQEPGGRLIPGMGDFTLINRGPALGSYDRRVFASCVDYYKDRPLSPGGDSSWVEVSFYLFVNQMGVAYSAESHRSLRASLERLSALSLHLRHDGFERHLPRILEVSFADGKARGDISSGSDKIVFRVLEPLAELYGPAKWTAVPHSALNAGKGLKSWVATFYSTHRRSLPLPLALVQRLTGTGATTAKFTFQLKESLKNLQESNVPEAVRVADYSVSKTEVTVHLTRWGKEVAAK
ncbi:hypothetical protein AVMA1855_18140 [Acidovorax sp. SUPP1855]|nr:hypothetical protein AVMA1855_18140 [Acidovorax sp. SUPP1855]